MAGRGGDPRQFLDPFAFGGAGDSKYNKPQIFNPEKGYSKLKPAVVNPPARFTDKNVFASQPRERFVPTVSQMNEMKTGVNIPTVNNTKSEGFFKKADPTPMNQAIGAGYIPAWDTEGKFGAPATNQYDALTNLTKMREMSLSGQLKGLAPVYGNDGRITGWQKSDAYQYIVPGYDLDGVAFSEKQSAMRTGIDPKAYQAMGLGERASHLGTEVKSMGSELGTGFSRVVDDAKGIISNLPFMKFFGSGTTNNNTQQNNQQNVNSNNNTGVMANVQSFDPPTSSTSGQLAGMSPEMLQYYLGLSDVDKQAFLGLDNAGRMAMMKPSGGQEDQNYNFLGQYVPNTLSGMMDQNISYLSNAQLRAYNSMSPEEQAKFRSLESLSDKFDFLKSKFPDLK